MTTPFTFTLPPAHTDGTGHAYHLNDAGESVCDGPGGCGKNLGVLEWKTDEMVRHACPTCHWTQNTIPAIATCPQCATSLTA